MLPKYSEFFLHVTGDQFFNSEYIIVEFSVYCVDSSPGSELWCGARNLNSKHISTTA